MLNDVVFCEYIDRARTVTQYFEDVIMTCVYTSMPLLGELSNEAFLTHVRDRGYRNYSMNNPFKKWDELSPTEKKLGGANPADSKIADQQMYCVEAYIENYVGIAEDESNRPLGTNGAMVFTRTLMQWRDVDLKARTKYDAFISSSLSLLGNQGKHTKEAPKPIPFKNPFAIYNNDGVISKRL